MPAINRHQWTLSNGKRVAGFSKEGFTGDFKTTTAYNMVTAKCGAAVALPNGAKFSQDIPSLSICGLVRAGPGSFPTARNGSYVALIDKAREGPASLGVAILEWKESSNMIYTTAAKALAVARNLRKGKLDKVAKILGLPNGSRARTRASRAKKRKHKTKHTVRPNGRNTMKRVVNRASGAWLQYSFGWKPMMQDMYDAATVLGKDVPNGKVSAGSGESYRIWENGINSPLQRLGGNVRVRQYGEMSVDNHNSFMLQNMGLLNPVSIAYELIPFSFLADWCFDLGSALDSLTAEVGMTVQNTGTSITAKVGGNVVWIWPTQVEIPYVVPNVVVYHRKGGLSTPMPNLNITTNLGTSFSRAANAVSLLGQFLTR